MMRPQIFTCFGLVIHGLSLPQALAQLDEQAKAGKQSMVVTANPEILLSAKKNPAYWNVLRQADLRLVDGFGLQLIGWFFGARPKRIAGVKFAEGLMQLAATNKWTVGFIGGDPGNADKAAWTSRKSYPELTIVAEEAGIVTTEGIDDEKTTESLFRLTQAAPDILLVAFGHPKQEAWIVRHLADLPSVKIIVGVGGTFEYWAGTIKRAPMLFQTLGIEWLWRLILQPKRIGRIWNAVIRFPLEAIKDRGRG